MSDGETVRQSRSRWFGFVVGLVSVAGITAALAALVPFDVVRPRLDALAGDGSAEPYTPTLHHRLQVGLAAVGASLIVLGAILWVSRHRLAATWPRLRQDFGRLARWVRALSHGLTASLIAMTIVAAAVRVPYLNQPMRFDEAYTYNVYSSQPWFVAISKYDAPNNHVLHSALVLVSTRMFGDSPWAVRLPAFLAGVLLVPATMLLSAAVGGRRSAILAGLLVATSSPLIEYSTNARGYTLVCVCTVGGWLLALRLVRRCDCAAWLGWGALAVVGCWAIPVMVYPLLMQLAWMECQCRTGVTRAAYGESFRVWSCGVTAAAAAVTLVCYLPVLLVSGPGSLFGNGYVQALSLGQFLSGASGWFHELTGLLWRDVPLPVQVVCLAGLVLALRNGNGWVRHARRTALGSVTAAGLLMLMQRVLPFPRVWLFLLPLGAVLIGAGLVRVIRFLPLRPARAVAFFATIAVTAIWPLVNSIRHDSIRRSLETGTLPDAEYIVHDLHDMLRSGEPVITVAPSSAPLVYYARRAGLDLHSFDPPGTAFTRGDCAVVVVNRRHPEAVSDVLRQLGLQQSFGGRVFRLVREYPSARLYQWVEDPP
jgi:hypothetical protein